MTTFSTNSTSFGATSIAARISGVFHTVIASIVSWNKARITRNVLSSLTNRELEDIGLIRADIATIANAR